MLSEEKRTELQNNLRDFYNSKKGEKILRKNNKKDLKDFKKKRGWFSPEEDEACKFYVKKEAK